MTTYPWRRLALACWVAVFLFGGLEAAAAPTPPAPVPMGNHTYRLVRSSRWAFSFNTDKLEKRAREDAAKFCADQGKVMKEVSISSEKASLIHGGFTEATLIFKALDPGDPELGGTAAPGAGLSDLQMLVELHNKKLLSDGEYEAARQRLDQKSNDLNQLLELKRRGVLTEAEFEAARARLTESAK